MRLISVNIGQRRLLRTAGFSEETGIFKTPISTPAEITPLGLVGDVVADQEHHGGLDQAVYLYGEPDYAWWSVQLGYELAPGTFGENLTISGLESAALHIGDILQVGEARLQVTAARIPCATLAARMGDPGFVKRFRAAERPGAYCRVLQPGVVRVGDAVTLEPYPGVAVTVAEMFRAFYNPRPEAESIRRLLETPLAERARAALEEK
ncbi:MOSC domain-containing protein [Caldilinea sp.]|jgi:MOSC domain-containing protein YiiM|uniref:MOSC domain-containing protein n=2 Tax=Caldilinea sp. TaxID=2293560 RepID=UPI0021DD92D9|nr:MOSC domain-containing protein [Caldilinea sp.]GIV69903.1 MAG: MOSC domain-containing protein [Caldilinea sp.]